MARVVSQSELKNVGRFGQFAPGLQARPKDGIPEVYNPYKDEESGHTRIIMEFVELEEAWDKYSDAAKEVAISQLRCYMKELR
ncbi:hypothetical protein F4776DRAFT_663676 [Hypoxylon sp. NC0597]|nr:hypothetical protein F4776DRAFT_663676 [Hypoxylon sp. NC0597]